MSKYIFKKIKDPDNQFEHANITFEIEADSADDIVEEFAYFLKACSFRGDIKLEIGTEDE